MKSWCGNIRVAAFIYIVEKQKSNRFVLHAAHLLTEIKNGKGMISDTTYMRRSSKEMRSLLIISTNYTGPK